MNKNDVESSLLPQAIVEMKISFCIDRGALQMKERGKCNQEPECRRNVVTRFFRFRAFARKRSLEVILLSVCMFVVRSKIWQYSICFVKLNYGTPHMTIYETKWTRSGPEVDRIGSKMDRKRDRNGMIAIY